MSTGYDAVVIGSGPNGLAGGIKLAQVGASVLVLEAMDEIGGGIRTSELTLPDFHHDVCASAHPMGILSPYLSTLPLAEHGLEWIKPPASVAHPLDDDAAVMLWRSVEQTKAGLGCDDKRYGRLVEPYLDNSPGLFEDALGPVGRIPSHPVLMARFGLTGLRAARELAGRFKEPRARALFAGCAAHSILPLERRLTGAVGLLFLLTAHVEEWPVVKGGSGALAAALASYLQSFGGRIETGVRVRSQGDLPPARIYLFDTSPAQLAEIAGSVLPDRYVKRLRRYRYGPGAFKLDWAARRRDPLEGPQLPERLDRPPRRHARGDRRRRGRRLARAAPRPAICPARSAEPVARSPAASPTSRRPLPAPSRAATRTRPQPPDLHLLRVDPTRRRRSRHVRLPRRAQRARPDRAVRPPATLSEPQPSG
jgi:phytoene dehydrogenase-like protein